MFPFCAVWLVSKSSVRHNWCSNLAWMFLLSSCFCRYVQVVCYSSLCGWGGKWPLMMIVLVTKYRLTGCYCFIADSVHVFSTRKLFPGTAPGLAQLEGTAAPQIGAASERRQFKWQYHRIPTGSREEAGSECFGTFGTFHQFYAAKNITISTNCNRHHQFKWQYHPIPTSDDFSEEKNM